MSYKELYFQMFAASADAVELLEQGRPERAKEILIEAQQAAEEKILAETDSCSK